MCSPIIGSGHFHKIRVPWTTHKIREGELLFSVLCRWTRFLSTPIAESSGCQFNRSCVNRIKVMRSHKDDLPTLPNLPGFGTLQFFRSKLLFVLLSKIASSLLSFAPLIKEEGVKIPPLLHSRKSLSYTSKWRFLVSKWSARTFYSIF